MTKRKNAPATPADAAAELRLLIREAHEATAALREERRRAEQVAVKVADAARIAIGEEITEIIREEVKKFQATTQKTMNEAVEEIINEFAMIRSTLLGESDKNRRASLMMAARYVASGGVIEATPRAAVYNEELIGDSIKKLGQ